MRLISFKRFRENCKHAYIRELNLLHSRDNPKCTEKNCPVLGKCRKYEMPERGYAIPLEEIEVDDEEPN